LVKVRKLGPPGHEEFEMSIWELVEKIREEAGKGKRYWVVDEETKKVIDAMAVKEDQKVALIPIAAGG